VNPIQNPCLVLPSLSTVDGQAHAERRLDKFGMLLSGLCLIHCLCLPLLAVALPFLGSFVTDNPAIHYGFAMFAVPIGMIAFIPGYRQHHKLGILALGLLGLSLLVSALIWGEHWEHQLTILGGLCLVTAHVYNYKSLNRCQCSCSGHAEPIVVHCCGSTHSH
jgi:hypothetical protein